MLRYFIIAWLLMILASGAYAQPLSLEESVDFALKHNPSIIAAQKKVEVAENKVGQAMAVLLPSLSLDAGYSRSYQSPSTTAINMGGQTQDVTFGFDQPSNVSSYMFSLSQPIYNGALPPGIDIANKGLEAAKEEFKKAKQSLTFDIVSAYYGFLKAQKMLSLSQESLAQIQTHLEQTQSMFKVGLVTKADVLRAEVQMAEAEQGLLKAQNGLELAKGGFNNILGRGLDETVELKEREIGIAPASPDKYEELLNSAYQFRPDWKGVKLSERINQSTINVASSGYFPSIYLIGAYGRTKTDYPNLSFDISNWNVKASASWNLFNGFGTPAKVREAQASYEEIKANIESLKKGIALEVREAVLSLEDAHKRINASQKSVDLAKENFQIAELRFKAGAGTNIEVIDAQTALTSAKTDLLQAQIDVEVAKAKINKAVGKDIYSTVGSMITVYGAAKYIDLEGGFVGLIDEKGNKYDLYGPLAKEISDMVGKSTVGKPFRITGYLRPEVITIRMWGTPFEVTEYEWK